MSSALSLVQLAFAGTAALIVVAYAMKFERTKTLVDDTDALGRVQAWNPDLVLDFAVVSFDKRCALVRDYKGRVYGVFAMGDDFAVRALSPATFKMLGPERVLIGSQDLGFPAREFSAPAQRLNALFAHVFMPTDSTQLTMQGSVA